MNSLEVRKKLSEALELDLVGPGNQSENSKEALLQTPSRWYLTGFLAPLGAKAKDKSDETFFDEIEQGGNDSGADENTPIETKTSKRSFFPSSIGISFIVGPKTQGVDVTASWGEYLVKRGEEYLETKAFEGAEEGDDSSDPTKDDADITGKLVWERQPKQKTISLNLNSGFGEEIIPDENGLCISFSIRPIENTSGHDGDIPKGSRSVSVFFVNRREPLENERFKDRAFIFQVGLKVDCSEGFVARPNTRGVELEDPDEQIADLQYRKSNEYAVGHGIAAKALMIADRCTVIETCWMPQSLVERVEPSSVKDVEFGMEKLSEFRTSSELVAALKALPEHYQEWIKQQQSLAPKTPKRRADTALELLKKADFAKGRIADGINLLNDPLNFEAFKIANSTMALAARQRNSVNQKCTPDKVEAPTWRPFQLAFVLLNLKSIVDPSSSDRNERVDLLFFPTGGGKTEAYLGLTAFTLALRRLRDPTKFSAGVTVLMRYTLRLLTLDQLGRAATLICALELERKKNPKLGPWPFEIGLWVGQAATPNRMGSKGDQKPFTARAKTISFWNNSAAKPSPIPIEECPWCGRKFNKDSFRLEPNSDQPKDLVVRCSARPDECDFSGDNHLPIIAVDEQIYRRLPCFLIATVDKFAAMPWTGQVGALFGRVERHDDEGFYGPCDPGKGSPIKEGRLLPPELIIQDELHLISGPMGTMVGLYEGAVDELSSYQLSGKRISPKIIASTATVRRAQKQIQALFNRRQVEIFPPPGPDSRDSFFALTKTAVESPARMYVGVAAQGRSMKVTLLRTYLALLSAGQKLYDQEGGNKNQKNPVDPYMTLLGYFNSLRELGGSRRIVEDEIKTRLAGYSKRHRVGEVNPFFVDRNIRHEPVELTSRVSTNKVAEAKQQLSRNFYEEKERVDVALATNMISVGLDITRLGLMVVLGQPKTTAEYIQTTSRVGRDKGRPGLVITLFNIHRHRDRSHYERFDYYHQTFYRNVEVTSVTPFSPRALDRGLAATVVALARLGVGMMTAPTNADKISNSEGREKINQIALQLAERAANFETKPPAESLKIRDKMRARIVDLLDKWTSLKLELDKTGTRLQYSANETTGAKPLLHEFLDPELEELPEKFKFFRANRSMRDVETSVNVYLKTLEGRDIEEGE